MRRGVSAGAKDGILRADNKRGGAPRRIGGQNRMDSGMKRFLNEMADRAAAMAEGARDAATAAGKAVGEKKEEAAARLELMRLRSERESAFSEIGRAFYLMNAGRWPDGSESAEHRIESLLGRVSELEMKMKELTAKIAKDVGRTCPVCGAACGPRDRFCPSCGARLSE